MSSSHIQINFKEHYISNRTLACTGPTAFQKLIFIQNIVLLHLHLVQQTFFVKLLTEKDSAGILNI